MLWRAAVAWMSLVLAAGPGLCWCCAAETVLSPLRSDGPPAVACCFCGAERCSHATTDLAAGKEHCHCADKESPKATPPTADPLTAGEVVRLLALVADLTPLDAVGPPVAAVPPDPPDRPSVARRLLDRHHRLRC